MIIYMKNQIFNDNLYENNYTGVDPKHVFCTYRWRHVLGHPFSLHVLGHPFSLTRVTRVTRVTRFPISLPNFVSQFRFPLSLPNFVFQLRFPNSRSNFAFRFRFPISLPNFNGLDTWTWKMCFRKIHAHNMINSTIKHVWEHRRMKIYIYIYIYIYWLKQKGEQKSDQ